MVDVNHGLRIVRRAFLKGDPARREADSKPRHRRVQLRDVSSSVGQCECIFHERVDAGVYREHPKSRILVVHISGDHEFALVASVHVHAIVVTPVDGIATRIITDSHFGLSFS
jgi:hypothetical protein